MQGVLQRTAGFTGTNHADVEAGKLPVLFFQRLTQRLARLDLLTHAFQQGLALCIMVLSQQRAQCPLQWLTGTDQRGQLLGKADQRRTVQRTAPHDDARPAAGTGVQAEQQQPAFLQDGCRCAWVSGLQRAVLRNAVGVQCAVFEMRHDQSPRVTRSTSSSEVIPATA